MAAPMVRPALSISNSIFAGLCTVCSRHVKGNAVLHSSRSKHILSRQKTNTILLSKYISSSSLNFHPEEANRESLKEFEAELNVEEKPQKYKAWAPVDDVYLIKDYPPKETTFEDAMTDLRSQAYWSCVPTREYKDRHVEVTLHLDLNMGEKKLPAFSNLWIPPHHFWKLNKVICFAEGDEAKLAQEAGADLVVGQDQFPEIMDGEIVVSDYDYCVAEQNIVRHLSTIKKFLRDKFPTAKKGSAGKKVGPLIERFKYAKKYRVLENRDTISNCIIGNLGLSDEQIEDNLKFLIRDVCTNKPLSAGPLIKKVYICGYRMSSHKINFDKYVEKAKEKEVVIDNRTELEKIEDELRQLRAS